MRDVSAGATELDAGGFQGPLVNVQLQQETIGEISLLRILRVLLCDNRSGEKSGRREDNHVVRQDVSALGTLRPPYILAERHLSFNFYGFVSQVAKGIPPGAVVVKILSLDFYRQPRFHA